MLNFAAAFFLSALLPASFSFSFSFCGSAGATRLAGRALFLAILVPFVGSIVPALAADRLAP